MIACSTFGVNSTGATLVAALVGGIVGAVVLMPAYFLRFYFLHFCNLVMEATMATFERHVDVDWRGTVMEGKGEAKAGTGAFSLPVTFASRIGEPAGKTSPEELMAAAHAACYAMALNGTIGRTEGVSVERTAVRATITADKGDAGIKIMSSRLEATAYGVKGADAAKFTEIAKLAESRCPVSNAYRGTMQITVDAKIA